MKVSELIAHLQTLPQDMEVRTSNRTTLVSYEVEKVTVKEFIGIREHQDDNSTQVVVIR